MPKGVAHYLEHQRIGPVRQAEIAAAAGRKQHHVGVKHRQNSARADCTDGVALDEEIKILADDIGGRRVGQ